MKETSNFQVYEVSKKARESLILQKEVALQKESEKGNDC